MTKVFIQEIASPSCTHCAEAKDFFKQEIKPNFPEVEVRYIDIMSEEGQALVSKYMIFTVPAIFISGELVSTGGIDESEPRKKIENLVIRVDYLFNFSFLINFLRGQV